MIIKRLTGTELLHLMGTSEVLILKSQLICATSGEYLGGLHHGRTLEALRHFVWMTNYGTESEKWQKGLKTEALFFLRGNNMYGYENTIFPKEETIMKINFGDMENKAGEVKEVIVKSVLPASRKDVLIGIGAVGFGIIYLTVKAFKYGADSFYRAEARAQNDLGIITPKFTEDEISGFAGEWMFGKKGS